MSGLASAMGIPSGNLAEAVLNCAVPVKLIRAFPSATGGAALGRVNPPIERSTTIQLSVQPMSARELKMLPEGMRNDGTVKCYGPDELITAKSSTCQIPDKFEYRNVLYQVASVHDWKDLGGYFKTIATRVDR